MALPARVICLGNAVAADLAEKPVSAPDHIRTLAAENITKGVLKNGETL